MAPRAGTPDPGEDDPVLARALHVRLGQGLQQPGDGRAEPAVPQLAWLVPRPGPVMSMEPAMLFWLNNAENKDVSPNQNFARELMELFLLGVNQYTEDDVIGASRPGPVTASTGTCYHTSPPGEVPVYQAGDHAATSVTLALLGETQHWTGRR